MSHLGDHQDAVDVDGEALPQDKLGIPRVTVSLMDSGFWDNTPFSEDSDDEFALSDPSYSRLVRPDAPRYYYTQSPKGDNPHCMKYRAMVDNLTRGSHL